MPSQSGGRYCQMTMNLIKHGTNRAGFKDWPTYDNKPGPEEPETAGCAIPDPDWVQEPQPRTYNTNKTPTGEKNSIQNKGSKAQEKPHWVNINAKVKAKNRPQSYWKQ